MNKSVKMVVLVAVVVLFLFGGASLLAVSADDSIPGDSLYGVDLAVESLSRSLKFSDSAKSEFEQDVLDERMDELEELGEDAGSGLVEEAVENLDQQRDRVRDCVREMEDNDNADEGEVERVRNRYEEQVEEQYENMEQIQERLMNEGEDSEIKTVNKVMENYQKEIDGFGNGKNQQGKEENSSSE